MLPSSRRLTSAEVPKVLKEGRGASCGAIRVKYTYRGDKTTVSRFAVVVSKKVLKRAVDRNYVRRRVYAIVRGISLPHQIDGVVLVSSGGISKEELQSAVIGALSHVR